MTDKKIYVVTDASEPLEVPAGGKKKADREHQDMSVEQLRALKEANK